MRSKSLAASMAGICLILLAASTAKASIVVLDFTGAPYVSGGNSYVEDGFSIQSLNAENHFNDQAGNVLDFHSGFANNPVNELILTKVGGGNFDFLSFDAISNADGLVFTTNLGGTFTLAQGVTGTNISLTSSFQNISSVKIGYVNTSANTYYQELDNLRLDNAPNANVPEPATLAIWGGFGLVGLVVARRRKKLAV